MNESVVTERGAGNLAGRVELSSFRNYARQEVWLSPGFNVVYGPNAQGKTNLLEALALLSTGRLLRGKKDSEAIRDGAEEANLALDLGEGRTTIGVRLVRGGRKRATLNGMNLPRASDLIGRFPTVLATMEDLAIVRGEPADRRLFLDLDLSALYPSYLAHLSGYKRALEQRNALLKEDEGQIHSALYEPWEEAMATHGAALRVARRAYVAELTPTATSVHAELGQGEAIGLVYVSNDDASEETALRGLLEASRGQDRRRGSSSVGPHRDDLLVTIEGREARLFGSQGQQRTAAIAIKLATLDVCQSIRGETPMLLLDDMLSDLDATRRAFLSEAVLRRAGQAVLTCTESDAAGKQILERAALFEVCAGTVVRR